MKVNVERTRIVDKGPVPSVSPIESSLKYAETYDPDTTCPADIIDACQQAIGASSGKSEESVAGGNAADTVGASLTDKNAFPKDEFPGRSKLESRKSSSGSDEENDEERQASAVNQNSDRENEAIKECPASSPHHRRPNEKRLSEVSKEILKKISRKKPKKRRVNTIVLTNADFSGARIRNDANDDFSEFEEEDGKRVREEEILISELPYKPKADIGDLDRVTAEEFCPLTLEDEASCGETTTWP
ncbi:uncharacterized protein LOC126859126 isoform X2 [Cataglyphis hispanica]|nr:uncharacterized protein LOC126859126 isoform X2 [Cataglyphis hispanica]